jgi:hypothetical protein
MLEAVMPWPSVAGRVRRVWPWAGPATTWTFVGAGVHREVVIDYSPLPAPHPNLLWIAVPDVVRCACGARHPCVGRAGGPAAARLVAEARRRGLLAHAGRVSSARRIRYAQSIGYTSLTPRATRAGANNCSTPASPRPPSRPSCG